MITLEALYVVLGMLMGAFACLSLFDGENPRRFVNALFWALLAASFLLGSHIGDFANGLLVLALATLGGLGLGRGGADPVTREERRAEAMRRGNWIFAPALLVPAIALLGTLVLKQMRFAGVPLIDPKQVTLISLGLGAMLALGVALAWLRPRLLAPLAAGHRLMESIGWAAILPQMLASLGAVFALAGVGTAVGHLASDYLPLGNPVTAVAAYCIGMAVFTAIMGNAFAAFPVMTAAIGLPLVVHQFGGNAVIMAAIGMLSGFCGTLTTPMAANFNIVPAALLELPDRNAVIKAQLPTAFAMLAANTLLMEFLVYRF